MMELPNELHTMTGDREDRTCACDEVNGKCECRRLGLKKIRRGDHIG